MRQKVPGASWLGCIFRSISLEQRLNHPNSLPTSPAPGCRASAHIPRGQVDGTQGHGKGLFTGSRARTWEEGGRCRNLTGRSLIGPRALASLRSSSRQCFSSALSLWGRGALGSGLWWPPVCRKAPSPLRDKSPPQSRERTIEQRRPEGKQRHLSTGAPESDVGGGRGRAQQKPPFAPHSSTSGGDQLQGGSQRLEEVRERAGAAPSSLHSWLPHSLMLLSGYN